MIRNGGVGSEKMLAGHEMLTLRNLYNGTKNVI